QPPNERDAAGRHSPLASRRPPSTAGSDRRRTIRQKALLDRGARTNRRSVLPLVGTRSPRIARLPGLRIRLARLDNLSWRSGVPDTPPLRSEGVCPIRRTARREVGAPGWPDRPCGSGAVRCGALLAVRVRYLRRACCEGAR